MRSKHGKLCILYVLAKAKSLRTGKWVFRGNSASPTPILNRALLRMSARAFTCMLRMLQTELPHNFQCADAKQVLGRLHFVARKGARSLTEMDCKKQFDDIHPDAVIQAFSEASHWLYKKCKWH